MERTVETHNYGEVKLSGNDIDIIDLITKLRNDLIKDFLDERFLREYAQSKYHISDISNVKVEFIKKDLKDLYLSPLNTTHYQPLVEEIQTNERTSLAEGNEALFYREIDNIVQRYFF